MINFRFLIYFTVGILYFAILNANEPLNKDVYESLTGFEGSYNEKEKVFKVVFPRTDIKILVDNIHLNPFMGLASWFAFTPMDKDKFMVKGDLALFQDEVNTVMSILLSNGLEVTALHNHFFYDIPKVYFMHIGGVGSIDNLSKGIKKALDAVKDIRNKNATIKTSFGDIILSESSINVSNLEKIFGTKGQSKDGMVKFIFGRTVTMDNITIGSDMGVNTWVAFAGTNENAIVDGDFVVQENELQSILKTLIKGGINIVAIHHHMTMESPRLIFVHYWGQGNAEDLAKTLKEALNLTIN